MVDQADVEDAVAKQVKTWRDFSSGFSFFRDERTSLARPDIDAVFELESYTDTSYYAWLTASTADTYPWIARYWLNTTLDRHVNFMWNRNYESKRASGAKEKDAQKFADSEKAKRTKALQEKYP